MNIEHIAIHLGEESKVKQNNSQLIVSADSKGQSSAEYVRIGFEETYSIELKEGQSGKAVLVLTAGGLHRVLDLSALQHLVTMAY